MNSIDLDKLLQHLSEISDLTFSGNPDLVTDLSWPKTPSVPLDSSDEREVSWPKIPSVPLDGYHERESEGRRLFLMKKAAGGLMQTARFRQFDTSTGALGARDAESRRVRRAQCCVDN
jgi:hypothetical protein